MPFLYHNISIFNCSQLSQLATISKISTSGHTKSENSLSVSVTNIRGSLYFLLHVNFSPMLLF